MTGRERIEAALSGDGAREIAAVICYEHLYIRDHWDELTPLPWWYQHAPDVARQVAWRRQVMPRIGQDWLEVPVCRPAAERQYLDIEERAHGVFLVDRRSQREQRLARPRVSGWTGTEQVASLHPASLAESAEEVDAWLSSQAAQGLQTSIADGSGDLAARLLQGFADLYPVHIVESPLWRLYYLWGFEGLMTMVGSRPDLVAYACRGALDLSIAEARRAALMGAAGIWIEECLTDMISPQAFATLNAPFVADLVRAIRADGMHAIYYFCGNPAGKWDQIMAAGADALSLEESKKGFVLDIADIVARVQGRCTVLGNLDALVLLERGSEAELRAEIARQIAAGRRNGSRFIMSLGSPATPGTTAERVRLYCDLVHELGSG